MIDRIARKRTFDQQLRGFARVSLAPGETKRVQFEIKPGDLMLYDGRGEWDEQAAEAHVRLEVEVGTVQRCFIRRGCL